MFACSNCDAQFPKWAGRCTECGKWGTVVDENGQETTNKFQVKSKAKAAKSVPIAEAAKGSDPGRVATGVSEVDRVLGGGLVRGSLVLLSGEPGIGKSTLVAQIAGTVPSLYVSGEESAPQLAGRFSRLNLNASGVNFLEALPVETIVATIEKEKPSLAIIDSVQTLVSAELDSVAGTPAMVRYATSLLLDLAKRTNIPILLIGQVTKDGAIAGPKTLEHLVDVVVSLEGDPVHAYRLLRTMKNRFGSADEVGVFEMTATGLATVDNPSARFLEERKNVAGSVVAAAVEGSRVFLVEVQALVEKASYGTPVRRASGFDQNRLQMLCAILSKHAGLKLGESDVYVNVIGGLSLE
ncbi:DNA repair protein RadA, partial [bacterium]|nr:DNA repair protein RadA [bacterium]